MNKLLIIVILFFNSSMMVLANPNLQARTGILIDFHSGKVLYELDSDSVIYPASMTKIMTSIVAFDLLLVLVYL